MADIHQLIAAHGRESARNLISPADLPYFQIAASVLEEESNAIGITYSGFCLTSLPHRKLPDHEPYHKRNGPISLTITPGTTVNELPSRRDGKFRYFGVPFGTKARLILLYLQTMAIRTKSPEVELGRSMNSWLKKMGIPVGGKTYAQVRDQAERISRCNLTFEWRDGTHEAFRNGTFVEGGIKLRGKVDAQTDLWDDRVVLSDTFYRMLQDHPVPVWEPAIRHIVGKSMAFDIYVWLAYRLHVLERPTRISWPALFAQFGNGAFLRSFKPEFRTSLKYALAVYPDARITEEADGFTLYPSPAPISEKLIA